MKLGRFFISMLLVPLFVMTSGVYAEDTDNEGKDQEQAFEVEGVYRCADNDGEDQEKPLEVESGCRCKGKKK